MNNSKISHMAAVVLAIAMGVVAAKAKTNRGQGNLYFCSGVPLTCQPSINLSNIEGPQLASLLPYISRVVQLVQLVPA